MDANEIVTFLKSDEGKATLDTVASGLGLMPAEALAGLEKKNRELLAEKKGLKDKYGSLDLDSYNEYLEALKNGKTGVDVESIKKGYEKELNAWKNKATENEKLITEQKNKTRNLLLDNTLERVLNENRVASVHRGLLATALRASAEFQDDDTILIKSTDGLSLPVKEYAKNFFQSETGKIYVEAAPNAGGNAKGSGSATGKPTMTRVQWDSTPLASRPALIKSGVEIKD
jgi:hypothetical protein